MLKKLKLMKENIINLDETFMPFGRGIDVKIFDFPSGCEPHIKISPYQIRDGITITCRIQSTKDIILILLTVDALRRMGEKSIRLFIPYLPFARQDRVMVDGEPLSVKVMADLINSCGFEKVEIYDPHSEVALALINNCDVRDNHSFVRRVLTDKANYTIVCPDAGAYKKIFKLCQALKYRGRIALCNKIRNVDTGEILSTVCDVEDFEGKDVYIVDDICSKGGTFMLLSDKLRQLNCGKINLVVSHYENSADIAKFKNHGIDMVYKTNSMNDYSVEGYVINHKIEM